MGSDRPHTPAAFLNLNDLPARPPSQAQIDDVREIRALQVRTNAVQFAIALLGGHESDAESVIYQAKTLVVYLEGG